MTSEVFNCFDQWEQDRTKSTTKGLSTQCNPALSEMFSSLLRAPSTAISPQRADNSSEPRNNTTTSVQHYVV